MEKCPRIFQFRRLVPFHNIMNVPPQKVTAVLLLIIPENKSQTFKSPVLNQTTHFGHHDLLGYNHWFDMVPSVAGSFTILATSLVDLEAIANEMSPSVTWQHKQFKRFLIETENVSTCWKDASAACITSDRS